LDLALADFLFRLVFSIEFFDEFLSIFSGDSGNFSISLTLSFLDSNGLIVFLIELDGSP